jgi:isoquinoline 1-oxidoreductase beta subunit
MSTALQYEFAADEELRELILEAEAEDRWRLRTPDVKRRSFLKLAALAGGGLVLSFSLRPGSAQAAEETDAQSGGAGAFAPNAYLKIYADGSTLIYSKSPEIGQGIKTAFAMIVAEELDADWSRVHVEQAEIDPKRYGRQSAGGSRSIPSAWTELRRAGATARALLVKAAAAEWGVPEAELRTEKSRVLHDQSQRSAGYGELAAKAAALPLPDENSVVLKQRSQYKILGTRVTGVDNRALVTGKPLFGIDQVVPGMLYAVYEKCPATGGRVEKANLDEIKALPGVKHAFVLEGTGKVNEVMPGVAIVATSTWAALSARRQLKVTWDESKASKDNWQQAMAKAKEIAAKEPAETLVESGALAPAFEKAAKTVEGFYGYPFVAHAPLEPQNCTAWLRDGKAEVWAPTQTPDRALTQVAELLQIPAENVTIHQTRAGGGFGRRLINDPVLEAVAISKQIGAPVKLQWTREDDMTHDFYRVGGFHQFKGAVDAEGKLAAWQAHFISFGGGDGKPVSGGGIQATEFPALLTENFKLGQTLMPLATPCGPWRAPGSNAIAFAVQSFLHELAVAAGRDHLEFLLEVMGTPRWLKEGDAYALHTGRAANVIQRAAQEAGWGKPLPAGRGRGLAFHFSHAGHFAEVAEVSVDASKKLTVHRVTVAGDIGPLVNLSGAENQAQGSVIDGLSTMMGLELDIADGRVSPPNFDRYPLLRMPQAPVVDVHFLNSEFEPTGVGEPALPPLAPAICNAIFAATGQRVRSLPLRREGYTI